MRNATGFAIYFYFGGEGRQNFPSKMENEVKVMESVENTEKLKK